MNTLTDMAKVAKVAAEHRKKVQMIQSLSVTNFSDRQVLAMVYCSGGLDSADCSSFEKIVNSSSIAGHTKIQILMNLNVIGSQNIGAAAGKVAESYYKDALGIPIGRGADAIKSVSPSFSHSIELIERHCRINDIAQAGGCL